MYYREYVFDVNIKFACNFFFEIFEKLSFLIEKRNTIEVKMIEQYKKRSEN